MKPDTDARERQLADERAARRRVEQLQALTARLSAARTPVEVAHATLDAGSRALGAPLGALFAVERGGEEGDTLALVHAYGYDDAVLGAWQRRPLSSDMPGGDAIATRRPVLLASRDEIAARYPSLAPLLAATPRRASAVFPLLTSEDAPELGFVSFDFDRDRRLAPDEVGYLETLASLCAQALDRARLLDAERAVRDALEREQTLLRAVIEDLPVGVLVVDPQGRELLHNRALAELRRDRAPLDEPEAFARYRAWDAASGAPMGPQDWPVVRALRTGERQGPQEIRFLRRDGSAGRMVAAAFAIHGVLGDVRRAVAVVRDVSDEREAQALASRRERELARLAENVPAVIARLDAAHRHLYVNRAIEAVTGLPSSAFVGRTSRELGMPDALCDRWEAAIDAAIAGTRQTMDFSFEALDGPRHYRWDVIPEPDDDGRLETVLTVAHDVTELRRHEAALAGSESRLRFLVELNAATQSLAEPVEIMAVTARRLGEALGADRCLYATVDEPADRAEIVGGWERDAAIPRLEGTVRLSDFGTEQLRRFRLGEPFAIEDVRTDPRLASQRDAYRAVGTVANLSVGLRRDGRIVAGLGVHQAHARTWSADEIALVREVVARSWESVERARVEAALRESDRRKDEFLAMLAHELRNPLAPIVTAVRLLEREPALTPIGVRGLEMIGRQAGHMRRLVEDLLETNRISRGTVRLQPEPITLGALVLAAAEAALPAADAKRQTLRATVPPMPVRLTADPVRIGQVLENLLGNAIKYTPEGGTIDLRLDDVGDAVEIRVVDDGIGVDPSKLERVFELFVQGEPGVGAHQGGLGIGLALVRHLVELHGGTVRADSAGRGTGATFTVRLPRRAGAEARVAD